MSWTGRLFFSGLAGLLTFAAPALAQKTKDTVRIAQTQSIATLDAYIDPRPEVYFLADAIFDTLVVYDTANKEFVPLLAKSWKRIDSRTLEFEIRNDVSWHDGRKFTADDVVYTVSWLINPETKLRFSGYYEWIEKVEKTGPDTIRIVAKKPTPADIAMLASSNVLPILPKHVHEPMREKLEFGRAPVGTGPFRAVSFDVNKGVLLTRNESYLQANSVKGAAKVKNIMVSTIPEPGTRAAEMIIGQLDLMRDLPIDMAENLASMPNHSSTVTLPMGSSYLLIDAKGRSGRKELQDERVRRAIMMAVNPDELTKMVVGETKGITRPQAICDRAQIGCDYAQPLPTFDLEGARRLLAEAGYAKGFDVEITAPSTHSGRLAEALSGGLRQIGIRAQIDILTFAGYRNKQRLGKIEMLVNGWGGGGVPDVQATLDFFFAPGPTDYFGILRLSELARASAEEMDPAKRRPLVKELLDTVTRTAYMVPIAAQPAFWVHTRDIAISGDFSFSAWGLQSHQISWR